MRNQIVALVLSLLSIYACQHQELDKKPSANGVWESIGSGWVLQVTDSSTYEFYDITSISCLPSRKGDFQELQRSLHLKGDTLELKTGVITSKFTRSESLPDLCQQPSSQKYQDPLYNFEVFAETVREHYAFFAINNINWETLYQQQKSKLTEASTDVELYKVIEETFEQLNDNHAFLEASEEVYEALESEYVEEETASEELPEYGDFVVAKMVAAHHLQEELTKDSWLMQWGKMTDDRGYIQVKAMWLYADFEIPEKRMEELGYVDAYVETRHKTLAEEVYVRKEQEGAARIMERVMQDLSQMKSIVIDVRFNGGGQDAVSSEILSQFIPEDSLLVASQKIRYGNQFSPVLPLYIKGKEKAYAKPVYVLTSPQTGSAAEAFSIMTMAINHVKRIGASTSGALSTELPKTLPNGWAFSVSNEIYMDKDGNNYENIGVPVDYDLKYPEDRQTFFRSVVNDLEADKKSILDAIEVLEGK